MRGTLLFVVLSLSACTDTSADDLVVELGDSTALGQWVQPIIRHDCASLDCHGDLVRPLRLYALHGLRLDAELRDEDESVEELSANVLSIAGVDPTANPEDSLVLVKPLDEDAGGFEHVGGDLFADTNDPRYQCVLAWLDGRLPADQAAASACTTAAADF